MSAPVLIGAGVVLFALLVAATVLRGPLRKWGSCPIVLRRGHLIVFAVALTVPACTAMVVSLAGRVKLNSEIRARVATDTQRIRDEQITRGQVAGIVKGLARFLKPTTKEQLRRINSALKTCAAHDTCRRAFVQTVNRIIRSPAGRTFTVAPPRARPAPPMPAPPPRVSPPPLPTPPTRPRPGTPDERVPVLVHNVALLQKQVADLTAARQADSDLLTGLSHTVHDVENLASRIISTLCAPSLTRLLHLLGVCAA